VKKKFLPTAVLDHIYLRTNKIFIHNSLYESDKWKENVRHLKGILQLQ